MSLYSASDYQYHISTNTCFSRKTDATLRPVLELQEAGPVSELQGGHSEFAVRPHLLKLGKMNVRGILQCAAMHVN